MARHKNSATVLLRGDEEEARKVLPFAQSQFALRDKGTAPTFVQEFFVGGVRILLERNGVNRRITIDAEGGGVGLLCHPNAVTDGSVQRYRVAARGRSPNTRWRAKAIDPGTIDVNYGRRGWSDGKRAVSWSSRRVDAQYLNRIFYNGSIIFDWNMSTLVSPLPYYWQSWDDYQIPRILGVTIVGQHIVAFIYPSFPPQYDDYNDNTPRRLDVLVFSLRSRQWSISEQITFLPIPGRTFGFADYPLEVSGGLPPQKNRYNALSSVQGFSISPIGNSVLVSTDAVVYQFDIASLGSDPPLISVTTHDHPNPVWITATLTFSGILFQELLVEYAVSDGRWHVGAVWGEDNTFEWVDFYVSFNMSYYNPSAGTTTRSTHSADVNAFYIVGELQIPINVFSGEYKVDNTAGDESAINGETCQLIGDVSAGLFAVVKHNASIDAGDAGTETYLYDRMGIVAQAVGRPVVPGSSDTDILFMGAVCPQRIVPGLSTPHFSPRYTGAWLTGGPLDLNCAKYYHCIADTPNATSNITPRRWPSTISYHGEIAGYGKAFSSVPMHSGGAINFMTDNPDLFGVFPGDVNVTQRFDPIVPY